MKRKFKHASKSMLSVILAIMMALSTMFVGIVSVDAANNGDNLYVYYGTESQFTSVSSKPMTYSSNLYTTVIDFTDVAGWTWYVLSISSSASDRSVCWDSRPTITNNTQKITNLEFQNRDGYNNVVHFETKGDAPAGTSDLVKVTYDITANTITFDPGDSEPPTEPTTEPTTTSPTDPTTYYLGGRFKMKTASGSPIDTYTGTQYEWATTESKNIQFNKTAEGIYELNTYSTVSELSALSQGNRPPFFIVHDGKNMFGGSSAYHTFQDNTSENKASLKSINNTDVESTLLRFDGTDESGNVIIHLDTNSGYKIWCTIDGGSDLTPGAITLTDDTAVNGSLSFKAEGNTSGTADIGKNVTITANPFAGFTCSGIAVSYTNPEGTAVNESLTVDNNNTCTFTVPDVQATLEGKKSISFAASFLLNKGDYLSSKGEGLWIDVAPDKEDTTATLIKWNNYYGNNHATSNPYTFYVPKKVDLSNAKIYNGFGSDVTVNGKTIASKSFNADTDKISLSIGDSNTVTGINGVSNVKVMQGSTASMFLYTTDGGTTEYDLPTYKDDTRVQSGKYKDKYTGEYEYTKGSITAKGGTCTTITKDDKISTAMPLDQVKGRGNSSWKASATLFGKYAFNMKLSSKTNLYGLDAAKSWCLLANNMDQSMLRNAFTYDLAKAVGLPNSPEFEFVDIYDNGEYMGAYLVTEKVDVGKSKLVKGESIDDIHDAVAENLGEKVNESQVVDVDSQKSFTVTGEPEGFNKVEYNCAAVSTDNAQQYTSAALNGTTIGSKTYAAGTFLLEFEISKRVRNEVSWFKTPRGQYVVVKSPEFATEEEVKFIATKFVQMENKIYANVDVPTLSGYMDVDSFARMYLIQEISSNLDSAATSYYLTYCCADQDARFVASPVWDYDWAYGQHEGGKTGVNSSNNTYIMYSEPNDWFARYKVIGDGEVNTWNIQSQLANNTAFQTVIKKVWNGTGVDGFKGIVNDYCKAGGQLDTWKGEINNSIAMNEARWGFISDMKTNTDKYWGSVDTTGNTGTFDGAVNYLKDTWTNTRVQNLLDVEINKFGDYYQMAFPTLTVTAADGTALPAEVPVNTQLKFKADTSEIFVTYELYRNDVQVGTSNTTGEFDVTADEVGTFEYKVRTVYGTGEGSIKESQPVTVKVTGVELPKLTGVDLEANKTKVTPGTTVTLTATASPAEVTGCIYTFYNSNDEVVRNSSTSNTASVTLNTVGTYSYYVKASNNGVEKTSDTVTVTVEEPVPVLTKVTLTTSTTSVAPGNSITLRANSEPSTIKGYKYTFYHSDDPMIGDTDDTAINTPSSTDIKTLVLTPPGAGKHYYYVVASCDGKESVTSEMICVTVEEQRGEHTVRVWFKSASTNVYVPSVSLDGGAYTRMTRIRKGETNSTYFGSTYSGSLKFYWYFADVTLDSTFTHKLTFKTAGTSVIATSESSKFNSDNYYFAVDNLMNDTKLVDLTDKPDYIRNYHRSATHMVYNNLLDADSSLGFTYVYENGVGKEYPMGYILKQQNDNSQNEAQAAALNSRLVKIDVPSAASLGAGNAAFTIESATLTQRFVADIIDVSELQRCLLDVNLDEQVDIRDVTLMQKALAQ